MLWPKYYGGSAIAESGGLTPKAKIWQVELSGYTQQQITQAFEPMKVKYKTFPPNAMEFKTLVSGEDFDSVLDEILDYINRPENDGFEWQSQLAFNVYHAMRYSKQEALTNEQLVMRCRNAFKAVDRSAMFPIRNKEPKQLPPPIEDDEWTKSKRAFHSLLTQGLFRIDPGLFITDKLQPISSRQANREPQRDLPPLMKKLFNPVNAMGLMKDFVTMTGFTEKRPKHKDFATKEEWSKAFVEWRERADVAMNQYCKTLI